MVKCDRQQNSEWTGQTVKPKLELAWPPFAFKTASVCEGSSQHRGEPTAGLLRLQASWNPSASSCNPREVPQCWDPGSVAPTDTFGVTVLLQHTFGALLHSSLMVLHKLFSPELGRSPPCFTVVSRPSWLFGRQPSFSCRPIRSEHLMPILCNPAPHIFSHIQYFTVVALF